MRIRPFRADDEEGVVALWKACDLTRPWNDPRKDIARKLTVQPELFLVGEEGGKLVATLMAGYEGHRGWVNYLAVSPDCRRQGFGRVLMQAAEERLRALGCPKLNIQVRSTNAEVLGFYRALGYAQEERVSLGKRLIPDMPTKD
jgi:ribosomal protein S18 acetylase RimI-like enzyme